MVRTELEGLAHQIKGAVKQGLGKLIGDAKLAADGTAERASGETQFSSNGGIEKNLGIDPDRLKGVGHQLRGALKAGLGGALGNPDLARDGNAERAAGKAQNAAGGARDAAIDAAAKADHTHNTPSA